MSRTPHQHVSDPRSLLRIIEQILMKIKC